MPRRLADGLRAALRRSRMAGQGTGLPRWTLLPRDDVPMQLPHGRRAHEGARPAWRPRSAWLWMLAFRRQHHQEIATVLSDLDATEPHITELYTKAVEQLGSDEAPVRFGGLYALERLAQDNPAHRQTIVNVICAYLRMPFSPTAPASRPEPEAAEGQKSLALRVKRGLMGLAAHGRQERQVRLTAQRILAEHLRDDRAKDQQSTDPASSRFWNNIRLDLTGATLIDFNLINGVMADANFHRATFSGDASFGGATFSGAARFGGATFSGDSLVQRGGLQRRRPVRRGDLQRRRPVRRGDLQRRSRVRRGDLQRRQPSSAGRPSAAQPTSLRRPSGAMPCSATRPLATAPGSAGQPSAATPGSAERPSAATPGSARRPSAATRGSAGRPSAATRGSTRRPSAATPRSARRPSPASPGSAGRPSAATRGSTRRPSASGASFGEATFTGNAWFGEAAFSGDASFDRAAFSDAWFGEATFSGDAVVRRGDLQRRRVVRHGDVQPRRFVRRGGLQRRRRVRRGGLQRESPGSARRLSAAALMPCISSKRESFHPALHMCGQRDGASLTPTAVDTRLSARTTTAVLELPGRRAGEGRSPSRARTTHPASRNFRLVNPRWGSATSRWAGAPPGGPGGRTAW